ncbi:hypothetical protein NPN18_24530, partial [Vibrio parahaemolyticus]|nr:hypothetical protein [Vibrio parahaemolyticus]
MSADANGISQALVTFIVNSVVMAEVAISVGLLYAISMTVAAKVVAKKSPGPQGTAEVVAHLPGTGS